MHLAAKAGWQVAEAADFAPDGSRDVLAVAAWAEPLVAGESAPGWGS